MERLSCSFKVLKDYQQPIKIRLRALEGTFKARKPRHELQIKANNLETIQSQAGNLFVRSQISVPRRPAKM